MIFTGDTVIIEHKSSSQDIEEGSAFWKRLRLDSQSTNYFHAARAMGFEPKAVLFDVVRKPRFKPLKATPVEVRKYTKPTKAEPTPRLYANQRAEDETLDEYRMRLRTDIEASPDSYYKRGVVVRSQDEEREGRHDAWDVADQITLAKKTGRWMRNVDACERFNRFCDHWAVCCGETSHADLTRFRQAKRSHEELDGKHRLPLVTTSGMKTFRRCAREYFFSYEQGYRSVERADALAFGTLLHAGLEVWWKTVDLDAVMKTIGEATTDPLHLVMAQELMRGYHARWCEEPFNVLAVEHEFAVPLLDPTTGEASKVWELGGKIDAIATRAA